MNTQSESTTIRASQRFSKEDSNMKKITIRGLITGTLFMGVLALNPSAQAEQPTIDEACIFFNKIVYHVSPDLETSSGFVLLEKDTRVIILQGPKLNTRQNETEALINAVCGTNTTNCIHTKANTFIDSVEFSADCDDKAIRNLTGSKSPAP